MTLYDSILITGGGGMLAHAFDKILTARGHAPKLLKRADLDISSELPLARVFSELQPTLLLNCAAHTKVDLCEQQKDLADEINGYAVGNLARQCKVSNVPLVHFSTDYVFDGSVHRPLQPNDPTGPQSVYGSSKLLGEELLQQDAPQRWLIIRTAWLYGPNGPCFPATMVNLAKQSKPLKVVDDQIGSPTYTFDLAEATLNLLDAGANGIWHLANAGQTSWHDFTAAILEEFNVQTELSRTTSGEWKKFKPDSANRPSYSVLDIAPYEALTGKKMPAWRDALHRYRLACQS